jgi:cellulase
MRPRLLVKLRSQGDVQGTLMGVVRNLKECLLCNTMTNNGSSSDNTLHWNALTYRILCTSQSIVHFCRPLLGIILSYQSKMWCCTLNLLLSLLPIISLVTAHGRVVNITTSTGVVYTGWDPALLLDEPNVSLPPIVAWSASNLGNTFVPPSSFNSSDITCHFNATPGVLHVNVSAGEEIILRWNEWPTSHVGPVLSYLASCGNSGSAGCTHADKSSLTFVKIDELGWLNSTGWETNELGGTWATDVLISNRYAWTVKIPSDLAPGAYVLRHEIIALHVANDPDGAQPYPQCVNLKVEKAKGSGKEQPKVIEGGIKGNQLYTATDRGILIDVHREISGYDIPGPKLWSGASSVTQPGQRR